jgi:hypothetical protein
VEEPPDERRAPAWFPLSEQFTASGFIGEAAYPQALKLRMGRCPPRDPGAVGQCFAFFWKRPKDPLNDPIYLEKLEDPSRRNYIGVIWQSPPGNWGEQPPKFVEAGARLLSFKVRGSKPGVISAKIGGLGGARGEGLPDFAYADVFNQETGDLPFTNDKWTQHTIQLRDGKPVPGSNPPRYVSIFSGEHEDGLGILGPFGWIFRFADNEAGTEEIEIYFDDIEWGYEPPAED